MLPHLTNDIQASVNQMSGAGKLVQQALGSMLEILKQEVFNATTVNLLTFNWTALVQKPMQPQYFVCGQYFCSLLFSLWTHLVPGEGGGVGLRPSSDQTWQRCLARRAEASL